jgi:hypothetical protein
MDLWNEIEAIVEALRQQSEQPDEPDHNDIKRWQSLFGFSYSQALKEIKDYRSDLSKSIVSEAHWEMVRVEKEAYGFNKEAYEYSGTLKGPTKIKTTTANGNYLLRLEGPLGSLEAVKEAAHVEDDLQTYSGVDDDGNPAMFVSDFCCSSIG